MKENSKNPIEVYCKGCELKLDPKVDPFWEGKENPKPCPKCGSIYRQLHLAFSEEVPPMYDDVTLVATTRKETGGKKLVAKGKFGTELHHDTNTLQERDRFIDLIKGTYYERISNVSSGFFEEVNEPLSDHQGHGSAKNSTKGKPSK